jgi:putative Mn2+ efflux pump MntP
MFTSLLTTSLLLGLDSLLVCLAVGALPEGNMRRHRLALSFALCDGLASLIGSVAGVERLRSFLPWSEGLGLAAVAAYGIYVLYLAWRCQGLTMSPCAARWLVFSLPICLSLDNLVAGIGPEASGVPVGLVALIFGVMSGGLALLGIGVGSALGAHARRRTGWLGGTLLLLVSGFLTMREILY